MKMLRKANYFLTLLLLSVLFHQTVSHTQRVNKEFAHFLSAGTCVGNEQRQENQVACKGQPFGELVPYPGVCAKFLVCNCEYPTVKDCAAGTWFDNKLKICNFPQNVDCGNSGGATTTTTTTSSTSEPTSATTEPTVTLPQTRTSVTTTEPCHTSIETTTSVTTTELSGTSIETTTSVSTATLDDDLEKDCIAPEGMAFDICSKYDNGILLRYPYDCNAYINCTQGCPVMTFCVPGKVFNDLLKICDTPETAHCENLPMPSTTTEINTPNTPMVCEPPSGISADYCARQDPGTLLPYPYDCSAYILCNWLCPFLRHCGPQEVFNVKTGSCDCANTIECVEIPYPTLKPTTVTTDNPITPTPMVCEPPAGISADYCARQDPGTLLPYPYNCSAYILCNWLCPFLRHCAPQEVFNVKTGSCDCANTVECVEIPYPTLKPTSVTTDNPITPTPMVCEPPAGISANFCALQNPGTRHPYPYDCSAYILCNWLCPFLRHCGPQEVFNVKTGSCDCANTVECVEIPYPTLKPTTVTTDNPITPTPMVCEPPAGISADYCARQDPGTLLPYPYDCSAYILCNWLCPFLRHCGPQEVFNFKTGSCDCANTVECVEIPYPTLKPTTVTTDNPITPTPMVCEPPAGISANFCALQNPGTLHPYPYDCSAYILCNWLCPFLKRCQPNEVFNDKTGSCDCAHNVECVEIPYPTTETSEPTTGTPTDNPTINTPMACEPPNGISADICAKQNPGTYLSYPYNCSAYIRCNWLCPHLRYCGPGKEYNALLEICDSAENVKCIEIPYPTPNPTESTYGTTEGITTENPTLPPDVNPKLCEAEIDYKMYPYEGHCQQYVLCIKVKVEIRSCPEGWLFNAELAMCDEAGEEVCYNGTTTAATETTAIEYSTNAPIYDLCKDQPRGTSFPYRENCQMYYYCRGDGTVYLISCPFNNYYDPYSGDCGPEVSITACKTPPTTLSPAQACEEQSAGSTLPYEANCRQYIMCMGGGRYQIINCPANNFYYPDSGDCGPSADEDICRKGTSTAPTSSTSPTTTTTTTVDPTSTSTITTTTTTEAPSNGICGSHTQGELIEYPYNCRKYINCVRPIPIGFHCPSNWYFNSNQLICIPDTNGVCNEQPPTTTIMPPTTACDNKENGELALYPDNCQMFYECLGNGYFMLRICPENEYFDPLKEQCSRDVDSEYCHQDFDTTTALVPTTTPSPSQNLCYHKPIGSKIPYPGVCSKYIVCEQPIPVGHNCPQGLEFNSMQEKCVEPKDSDCGGGATRCSGISNYTLLPYENDCSLFVICLNNLEYVAYCNHGQYFDSQMGECSSEANIDSCLEAANTTTTATTVTKTTFTSTSLEPSSTVPSSTTEEPITTTTPKSSSGGVTCDGLPNGSTLTYPDDCSKYYICLNGNPRLTQCMPNSYYDPTSGECDSSSPSACLDIEETTTIITTSTASIEPTTTTTTTTTTEGISDPCYMKENGYTFVNTKNCSQFYMCLNDSTFLTNCPAESFYSPQLGECNSVTSSDACRDSESTTQTTESRPTTTVTPIPSHKDNICCGQEPNSILSHPNDKTKYVNCQYPLPEIVQCPDATIFDGAVKQCVSTLEIGKNPQCSKLPHGTKWEYVGNCRKYFVCKGQEAVVYACRKSEIYNPYLKKCVPSELYECRW